MPTIILVEPEIPENIGFVARAMKCYNLQDLVLVGHTGVPNASYRTGVSAKEILDSARCIPTLKEAIQEYSEVVAFSRRSFDLPQPSMTVQEYSVLEDGKSALVFGRESQGLFRDEIASCSKVVEIPTPHQVISFNLGQAVAIALSHCMHTTAETTPSLNSAPNMSQRNALITLLKESDKKEFLSKGQRLDNLRGIIGSLSLSDKEFQLLFGAIKSGLYQGK